MGPRFGCPCSRGWLSKLWSVFGYPKYSVPYYNRDPKGTIILTTTDVREGNELAFLSLVWAMLRLIIFTSGS